VRIGAGERDRTDDELLLWRIELRNVVDPHPTALLFLGTGRMILLITKRGRKLIGE